jgi:hypothetical protein
MANFTEYTRFAASYCPNLPTIVFSRAMLSVSRDYFTKTQAWQEALTVDLVADQKTYDMPAPFEFAIIDTVISASIGNEYLANAEFAVKSDDTGKPTHFALPSKASLLVYPTPKEAYTLDVLVSLKPSIDTTEIPELLFDEHFEPLIAGCIANIKRMKSTDWYDPQAAMQFEQDYNRMVDEKRIQLAMGSNNTELTLQHPTFM